MKSKQPASKVAFNAMADAIGTYLSAVGWRAVVIGSPRIQQPDVGTFNYEFVVRFTGGKRAALKPPKKAQAKKRRRATRR